MKVLILGGTGLISTAITREFLERGDKVTVYNRGIQPARFPEGAKFLHGDRNDFAAFEHQMDEAGAFDCVIDMICFTREQAESDVRAFSGRTGHFIFCSTVNVYTKPADTFPIREDARREPINDDYGTKKVECEEVFFRAQADGELNITVMRPAQTYGEGGKIVHTFGWKTTYLDRIRKGKKIIVHGDGTNLWVPCHIDDVGHAFAHAAGKPHTFGKAYHITGDELMTWDQYHQKVAQALNAPPPTFVHIPTDVLAKITPKRADITINNFFGPNVFDNSAAKRDLDFQYRVSWIEGIRRTVAWLDEHGMIDNSDDDTFDDTVIAAWEEMVAGLQQKLAGIDD